MSNPESDILHSWVAYTDPNSGQIFYYNTITQASQWDKPEGFEGSIEGWSIFHFSLKEKKGCKAC